MNQKLRIVFMGTPAFAVPSLDRLLKSGYDMAAVVTAADKPAGRGLQVRHSAVKEYALAAGLPVLQPLSLKDKAWIETLRSYGADLQVVVAFRMLPVEVWSMPPLGTLNLHASLLPQYRGAAPINWAIMNGENETGLTTFFLKHEIDTGDILFREKVPIGPTETAGELHDEMMQRGAGLLLKTVDAVASGKFPRQAQEELASGPLQTAPRIFRDTCRLKKSMHTQEAYNRVRGLSPYPAAFVEMRDHEGNLTAIKVYQAELTEASQGYPAGYIESDGRTFLRLCFDDGWLSLTSVQPSGKSRMSIKDFLNGRKGVATWSFS